MNYKVKDIIEFMDNWAKPEYAENWDNSGNQILFSNENVNSVIISLDVNKHVIKKAIDTNSKLIITHHPLFFNSIKSIDDTTIKGNYIIDAIKNNISIYSAHTTLDVAKDGVNDVLCNMLNLKDIKALSKLENGYMIGKYGYLNQEVVFDEFINYLKLKFKNENLKIYGSKKSKIKKIALCGGSGFEFINEAIKNEVDVYITADIKYHEGQYCYENNICAIDIGHFNSESPIVNKISEKLHSKFNIKTHPIIINDYEINIDK